MHTYVALLRGINVGGNKKVDMAKLRMVFSELGYENVRTYINSGNVIFESGDTGFEKIEPALKKAFGFEIEVVVRDRKNIQKIVKDVPKEWVNDKAEKCDVIFLWEGYDSRKSLKLIEQNPAVDTLRYIDGVIVWHIDRSDYSRSKMHDFIGTELYKHMTARNINTVRKLAELMA